MLPTLADTAAFEAHVLETATHFTAFQRRGPFDKRKIDPIATQELAREEAKRLVAEHPTRGAMIYAVNAAGRSVMVETVFAENGK
jgi:hypothetical protein